MTFAKRALGAGLCVLAAASAGWGQNYPLAEAVKAGDCFRVRLDMRLTGQMRFQKDTAFHSVKEEATAAHEFSERAMAVNPAGLIEKSARVYDTARAVITVNKDRTERTLRPERRLIVAQRHKDQGLVYSPAGSLLRSELDVCEHFDTLTLPGLLPGKDAAVGATWKIPSHVVQGLCDFDGLTEQNLTGKLEGVQGQTAVFSVTGTAEGIELGALVKLTVQATGRFDLKARRVVGLEWKQKDERAQGPASPASTVETIITLKRDPIEQPPKLSDVELISVPPDFDPPATVLQLEYRDPKGRFALVHGREWHLTGQTDDHVVMRLMDRGDFIAQVTLTPWTKAEKGKHLSAEEFKTAMNTATGWKPDKEFQAGEVKTGADDKRWVYRYSVLGELDGVAVLQNFYLIAAPGGEQLVLAFTMTPKQADKLGARDLALAGSIEVPAAK